MSSLLPGAPAVWEEDGSVMMSSIEGPSGRKPTPLGRDLRALRRRRASVTESPSGSGESFASRDVPSFAVVVAG